MIDWLLIFNTYSMHQIGSIALAISVHFAERKQFQREINVGQLLNYNNVRRLISDDQIFSSFKNRGTPQYFHNMLLDFSTAKTQAHSPSILLKLFDITFKCIHGTLQANYLLWCMDFFDSRIFILSSCREHCSKIISFISSLN